MRRSASLEPDHPGGRQSVRYGNSSNYRSQIVWSSQRFARPTPRFTRIMAVMAELC
jgi:hypothetical protein